MNKVLKWLDGKKTNIGGTIGLIISWAFMMDYLHHETAFLLQSINSIWFGVGIAHKLQKANKK